MKDMKLTIDGSLHKYFKGNNYDDFTFSEIQKALDKLNADIGIPLEEAQLLKLEVGVNIQVIHYCKRYWDILIDYKGKNKLLEMTPLTGTSKIAGKKLTLTVCTQKYYDKKWDARKKDKISTKASKVIPDNLLRIEQCMNSKKLKQLKRIHKVKDLRSGRACVELKKELLYVHDHITKLERFSIPSDFKPNEALLAIVLQSTDDSIDRYKTYLETQSKRVKSNERRKQKGIISKIPKKDNLLEIELREKIIAKLTELLSS
jgi:hypothetical protein